ncbi:helix-turn-helix domain-containing protein [Acinetobacter soli]|uniref:helix-turn-helix domain-containing protein n=1 Tax=Acinetobacter soli TaxID=487316 RepID=UPI00125EF0C7|nr:helix-turn-helix transcriptional regulator [Acinetobacter soli]
MFMSELTIQFGQLVRKYRKEKNMSQEQLALLCNMDRSYLGRIERGEVNPTLEKIYELANSLEVLPNELLPKKSENFK